MVSKSIPLKSIICALAYLLFSLLIILFVYIFDLFEITILLGILCGIVFAVVTHCDTTKRTIMAVFMGLLSTVASQILLNISGIPYRIIMYIYRNNEFVRETGRLTVNEVIGYNWGTMLFGLGLLISFIALSIIILVFAKVRGKQAQNTDTLHNC